MENWWDQELSVRHSAAQVIFTRVRLRRVLDMIRWRAAVLTWLLPKNLIERVKGDVQKLHAENPDAAIPIDLVTTSGSGLDPDISPEAAEFQIPRVAHSRNMQQEDLRALVQKHTRARELGFLGEPRVNVLELNLELGREHASNPENVGQALTARH
jgi:hypothetical protein